jgi:hypothetical protein
VVYCYHATGGDAPPRAFIADSIQNRNRDRVLDVDQNESRPRCLIRDRFLRGGGLFCVLLALWLTSPIRAFGDGGTGVWREAVDDAADHAAKRLASFLQDKPWMVTVVAEMEDPTLFGPRSPTTGYNTWVFPAAWRLVDMLQAAQKPNSRFRIIDNKDYLRREGDTALIETPWHAFSENDLRVVGARFGADAVAIVRLDPHPYGHGQSIRPVRAKVRVELVKLGDGERWEFFGKGCQKRYARYAFSAALLGVWFLVSVFPKGNVRRDRLPWRIGTALVIGFSLSFILS